MGRLGRHMITEPNDRTLTVIRSKCEGTNADIEVKAKTIRSMVDEIRRLRDYKIDEEARFIATLASNLGRPEQSPSVNVTLARGLYAEAREALGKTDLIVRIEEQATQVKKELCEHGLDGAADYVQKIVDALDAEAGK